MDKGQIAKENFKAGYNCAQAVVLAFKEELGIDAETLLKLSSSFGGGLARLREVCGAVSGGAMVLGILGGYTSPTDNTSKTEHYKRVRQFTEAFKEENGSIICRELLTGVKTDRESFLRELKRTVRRCRTRGRKAIIKNALAQRYAKWPPAYCKRCSKKKNKKNLFRRQVPIKEGKLRLSFIIKYTDIFYG